MSEEYDDIIDESAPKPPRADPEGFGASTFVIGGETIVLRDLDFELMMTGDERKRAASWVSRWGRIVAEATFELQEAKDRLEIKEAEYLVKHFESNKTGSAAWKGEAQFLNSGEAEPFLQAVANAQRNLAFARGGLAAAKEKAEDVRAFLYDRGYERRVAHSIGRGSDEDGVGDRPVWDADQTAPRISSRGPLMSELEARAEAAMSRSPTKSTDDVVVE